MIDLHCHILPGIDDGPSSIDESIEMCRIAASDGISVLVATPHFTPGLYEPSSEQVFMAVDELAGRIKEEGLELKLLAGADVRISPELRGHLDTFPHLWLNGTSTHFLIELPHDEAPHNWESFLLPFQRSGLVPVLTHPERNPTFMTGLSSIRTFVANGGLVQLTAMSITGDFGPTVQDLAFEILEEGLAHVIATDAHSQTSRPPVLSAAVKLASHAVGEEAALSMVDAVPSRIIAGAPQGGDLPGTTQPQ